MLVSIVEKSKINEEFRVDAEYYSPENLLKEVIVKAHRYEMLGDVCDLIAGPFGSSVTTDNYEPQTGMRYIRGKDIQSFFVEKHDKIFINNNIFNKLIQFHLKERDVLITVVGMKFGKSAIIYAEDCPAIFSCKSTLIRNTKVNPFYLVAYLSSSIGYGLIRRGERGAAQPGINLFDIRNVPVPIFNDDFQLKIEALVKKSKMLVDASGIVFNQTQTLLFSELGLLNWQPKHRLSFVKNYSDAQQSGRIDAEYFQPKYDELMEITSSNGLYLKKVSEIQTWNARGLQPQYIEGGLLDVVTSKHILENGIDYDSLEKTHESNWEFQKKARINKGDILTYTTGANIGRTACYSSINRALASNHVNILRIKNERPEYVAFVMNSIIGRLQTERLSAGSAQEELYPKDIEQFVIPFIDEEKQNKIIALIRESDHLKIQSKHLLESAKRAVEIAIEQDEQAAIKWLENELKESEK